MPHFTYVARNPQGKLIQGRTEAATQALVVKILKDQGLTPTSIQTSVGGAEAKAKGRKQKLRRGGVRIEDLVLISRQLATMIRAGLALDRGAEHPRRAGGETVLRNVLRQVERDVQGGSSFYEALARHPRVFNQFFLSMVKAGEASGMLDSILDQVATYLEKSASIRRKVKSAIMYPAAVSVFAVLIMIVIMWKVVPVFQEIFDSLGEDLPLLTKIVIACSEFVRDRWYVVLAAIVGGTVLFIQWGKTKSGRHRIDAMKLKLPIFRPPAAEGRHRQVHPLARHADACRRQHPRRPRNRRQDGRQCDHRGRDHQDQDLASRAAKASPSRSSSPGVFPPMVTRMIEVGERTGALENMLHKVAEYYEDQVDAAVAGLTSLIEPLLIMFLGVTIGAVVIAMFLPLIKMLEAVGKPAKRSRRRI